MGRVFSKSGQVLEIKYCRSGSGRTVEIYIGSFRVSFYSRVFLGIAEFVGYDLFLWR